MLLPSLIQAPWSSTQQVAPPQAIPSQLQVPQGPYARSSPLSFTLQPYLTKFFFPILITRRYTNSLVFVCFLHLTISPNQTCQLGRGGSLAFYSAPLSLKNRAEGLGQNRYSFN